MSSSRSNLFDANYPVHTGLNLKNENHLEDYAIIPVVIVGSFGYGV